MPVFEISRPLRTFDIRVNPEDPREGIWLPSQLLLPGPYNRMDSEWILEKWDILTTQITHPDLTTLRRVFIPINWTIRLKEYPWGDRPQWWEIRDELDLLRIKTHDKQSARLHAPVELVDRSDLSARADGMMRLSCAIAHFPKGKYVWESDVVAVPEDDEDKQDEVWDPLWAKGVEKVKELFPKLSSDPTAYWS